MPGGVQALVIPRSLATRTGGKDLPESEVILEACGIGFLTPPGKPGLRLS